MSSFPFSNLYCYFSVMHETVESDCVVIKSLDYFIKRPHNFDMIFSEKLRRLSPHLVLGDINGTLKKSFLTFTTCSKIDLHIGNEYK